MSRFRRIFPVLVPVISMALCLGAAEMVFRWKERTEAPATAEPAENDFDRAGKGGRRNLKAYSYFDWATEWFDVVHYNWGKYAYNAPSWEPYSLWKSKPFVSSLMNIDDEGYRVTVNPAKSAPRTLRVFFFGGSTAFAAQGPDHTTIASLLSAELNRRVPDIRFEVRNFGQGGFLSDQEVVLLTQRLTIGDIPDLVVFYDGVNDTIMKVNRGVPHFDYERLSQFYTAQVQPAESVAVPLFRPLRAWLQGNSAAARWAIRRVEGVPPVTVRGYTFIQDSDRLAANADTMLTRYRQNIGFVERLAAAYGFKATFFWQPDIFSTGKLLTDEEQTIRDARQTRVLAEGYRLTRARLAPNLAGSKGFHDIGDALDGVPESVFLDFCHVTAIANSAIAMRMVDAMTGASDGPDNWSGSR